jgi:predicted Fe-Mo cluster-binding NifX family protein
VTELGVEAVVTGHVGPKAFRTLQAAGVAVYVGAEGSVRQAVDALTAGRLERADKPNVEGHWV